MNVLNTNYPPNENALYWVVSAQKAGPVVIRISYLIGNMDAGPSYQGIVENDEKSMLLQCYMTVTNTSGESFGETTVQPGVGKTTVSYFNNGERKRMLAAKFAEVPIEKRYVFDTNVDQERTRMYYRLVNDVDHKLGAFPLPYGKMRLFIKEPKTGDEEVRSQAFLGEDWAQYTPLFADLDLYVGVAQDVKIQRFTMQPDGGPKKDFDEMTCPRHLIDGSVKVTQPQFRHLRTPLPLPAGKLQNRKRRAGHRARDDQGARRRRVDRRKDRTEGSHRRTQRRGRGERCVRGIRHGEADRHEQRRVRDQAAADEDRQKVRSLRHHPPQVATVLDFRLMISDF